MATVNATTIRRFKKRRDKQILPIYETSIGGISATTGGSSPADMVAKAGDTMTGNLIMDSCAIETDSIIEESIDTGVTIDGILLKDGGITATNHIYQGDSDYHFFGSDNDGRIGHDGAAFTIRSFLHGGIIWIQGEDTSGTNRTMFYGNPDGASQIRYAGSTKLATTNTGVSVTGVVVGDRMSATSGASSEVIHLDTTGVQTVMRFSNNASIKGYIGYSNAGSTGLAWLSSAGTVRMLMDSSGNLGINDTSPSYKLDVNGTGRFTGSLYCNSHAYQGDNDRHYFGTGNRAEVYHSGANFIIKSLHHGGDIYIQGEDTGGTNKSMFIGDPDGSAYLYYAGVAKLTTLTNGVSITGNLTATAEVTAYASDKRLKENIVNIKNPLSVVKQLNGVNFDWKDDVEELGFIPTRKSEMGFVAQDLQEVIPEAVAPAPFDNDYLTTKPEKLIPLLVEAIKELAHKNEELTNRIEQLEKQQ